MLTENEELNEQHKQWSASRDAFNKGLKDPTSVYAKQKWQKEYFQGGGKIWPKSPEHQTRLQQKEFEDFRPEVVSNKDQKPANDVRGVAIKIPGRAPLNIFIPNLGLTNDPEQKRTDYITTLQPSNAGGFVTSVPANPATNPKKSRNGRDQQRRVKELDSGTPVQSNSDSLRTTLPVSEGKDSIPGDARENGSPLVDGQTTTPRGDESGPNSSQSDADQGPE